MSYEVIFHPAALKEFDRLPTTAQKRLVGAVDALREEPRPQGSAKLTGIEAHRLRVGAYRIVYAIVDDRLIVLVLRVAHRGSIYKDLEAIRRRLR